MHLELRSAGTAPAPSVLPGLAMTAVGVAVSVGLHELVPTVGTLTWAVALGALAANAGAVPHRAGPGLRLASKRLLRVGVALLGFSLSVGALAEIGVPVLAMVVAVLVATLLGTVWLGRRLGIGGPRRLLVATGFAVCGASAVAAMQRNADADEEDVAAAVALVTLYGTLAMVALPLLQPVLGVSDLQASTWSGASVHEVGQVVVAAEGVGGGLVGVALAVKLTRVLMLAPVVAVTGLLRRRELHSAGGDGLALPPLVPLFVVAFAVAVALRSAGLVPAGALDVIAAVQTAALAAGMFALGTGVRVRELVHGAGPALLLGAGSTALVVGLSLLGVLWLV